MGGWTDRRTKGWTDGLLRAKLRVFRPLVLEDGRAPGLWWVCQQFGNCRPLLDVSVYDSDGGHFESVFQFGLLRLLWSSLPLPPLSLCPSLSFRCPLLRVI